MPAQVFHDEASGPDRVLVWRRELPRKNVGFVVTRKESVMPRHTDLDRPVRSAGLFGGELHHWECACGASSRSYFVRARWARKSLIRHYYNRHSPAALMRLYGMEIPGGETFGNS